MAEEIVVRYLPEGKVTVCIGERCVTLDCGNAAPEPDPIREPPTPPFSVQTRAEALRDLDVDTLQEAADLDGPLTRERERLYVERLDD